MVHFSRFASAGRAAIRAARASSPMPQLRRMRAAGLSESLSTAVVGVEAYARNLQWFHWGMAGGILAAFGTVYTANADGVPPGAKAFLMRWHSSIGMLVLGALGGRIFDFFDSDASGSIDEGEMLAKLQGLGFDSRGVSHLFEDIAGAERGIISRSDFLRYVERANAKANAKAGA